MEPAHGLPLRRSWNALRSLVISCCYWTRVAHDLPKFEHFLRLPRELRDLVYEFSLEDHSLCSGYPYQRPPQTLTPSCLEMHKAPAASILRVNKQIMTEYKDVATSKMNLRVSYPIGPREAYKSKLLEPMSLQASTLSLPSWIMDNLTSVELTFVDTIDDKRTPMLGGDNFQIVGLDQYLACLPALRELDLLVLIQTEYKDLAPLAEFFPIESCFPTPTVNSTKGNIRVNHAYYLSASLFRPTRRFLDPNNNYPQYAANVMDWVLTPNRIVYKCSPARNVEDGYMGMDLKLCRIDGSFEDKVGAMEYCRLQRLQAMQENYDEPPENPARFWGRYLHACPQPVLNRVREKYGYPSECLHETH